MEELKEYEIINNQKSAKQKLPFIIAISIVVIAVIVAVVFLITKKNTNILLVSLYLFTNTLISSVNCKLIHT